jgi:23S rRNA pseudouridine1911/1915/1917 synthase
MNLVSARGENYGVKHFLSSQSSTLVDSISETLGIDSSQIEELLGFGSVYVNGGRCTLNQKIDSGTYIRVHQNPRRFPCEVFSLKKALLFENEDLIVIDKPSGLPVHPTVDNLHENILTLCSRALGKELFVTHRLDVPTSGLFIFAKSKQSQTQINFLLSQGKIKKIYHALVHGHPTASGEITHYMQPSPRAPKTVSDQAIPGWAPCKLRLLDQNPLLDPSGSKTLSTEVTIELITGRTHQIRAQMSALGYPIVGDYAYGSSFKGLGFEKIALQCSYLALPRSLSPDDSSGELLSFRILQRPWTTSDFFAELLARPH